MCDWKVEQHRKRVASSLPSQPPIHHPFHHTHSHIPHFHYLRRMVLLGLPRLITDCRDSLFNPPQSHPKCIAITPVCNTECKEDSNTTRNDQSHESRFTRDEPYGRSIVLDTMYILCSSFQTLLNLPFHPPISPSFHFSPHFSLSIPLLTMLRCFWRCGLIRDMCKTKRRKKGCVWMKIWKKREVVGVTISHSNSHHSTLLQQTRLNYALTHAYLLPDVLTRIHVPFTR